MLSIDEDESIPFFDHSKLAPATSGIDNLTLSTSQKYLFGLIVIFNASKPSFLHATAFNKFILPAPNFSEILGFEKKYHLPYF